MNDRGLQPVNTTLGSVISLAKLQTTLRRSIFRRLRSRTFLGTKASSLEYTPPCFVRAGSLRRTPVRRRLHRNIRCDTRLSRMCPDGCRLCWGYVETVERIETELHPLAAALFCAGVNFMERTTQLQHSEVTMSIWDLGGKLANAPVLSPSARG